MPCSDTDAKSDAPEVVLGSAAGGEALFPALTRLELTTDNLSLHVASMPALRTLSLVPRDHRVACDLRDATQLTSLRWASCKRPCGGAPPPGASTQGSAAGWLESAIQHPKAKGPWRAAQTWHGWHPFPAEGWSWL